jgi:hypothetical protein
MIPPCLITVATRAAETQPKHVMVASILREYGTKYLLIDSYTTVRSTAKLVDTRTGTTLWAGEGRAQERAGGSGNLIADAIVAAVTQIINTATDRAHDVSRFANINLLTVKDKGLLYGPYHPRYGSER